MPVLIRTETDDDAEAIRRVHRLAFGREVEGQLVDALREGGYGRVSLVAEQDGDIVGHVLFSVLTIADGPRVVEALSLAPVAVVPPQQGRGVGTQLIRRGLELCREQGHALVFVLGDPRYYGRFGFSSELGARVESPYAGEAFQALELTPGALEGVTGEVRYPPPFDGLE
jgi:putative acetyltransferase